MNVRNVADTIFSYNRLESIFSVNPRVARGIAELYDVTPGATIAETTQNIINQSRLRPCYNARDPVDDFAQVSINFFTFPFIVKFVEDTNTYCFHIFRLKEYFQANPGEKKNPITLRPLSPQNVEKYERHLSLMLGIARHGLRHNPYARSAEKAAVFVFVVIALLSAVGGLYYMRSGIYNAGSTTVSFIIGFIDQFIDSRITQPPYRNALETLKGRLLALRPDELETGAIYGLTILALNIAAINGTRYLARGRAQTVASAEEPGVTFIDELD